jgi:hypothetical protein
MVESLVFHAGGAGSMPAGSTIEEDSQIRFAVRLC